LQVEPCHANCRNEPEQDRARHREHQREREHRRVERGILKPRNASRAAHQKTRTRRRNDKTEHRAADTEQQALDQQLRHDSPSRRPERATDCHLRTADVRAREQEARDVSTRDQQDQSNRAEQHIEARPMRSNHKIDHRHWCDAAVVARMRILARQTRIDLRELSHRRGDRYPGPK